MQWFRGCGVVAGLAAGIFVGCTDRPSPVRSVAREFAAHLCPLVDACPCEHVPDDCEQDTLTRVGSWERQALEHGLTLDEDCLDAAVGMLDGLAACGRDWFEQCYVYTGDAGLGESCETIDGYGLMSPCSHELVCIQGKCVEREPPVFGEGERCVKREDGQTFPLRGRCADGLRCDWEARVCIETKPIGSICTRNVECQYGDYCQGPSPGAMLSDDNPGVCTTATKRPDEDCEYEGECVDSACIEGICFEIPQPPSKPLLCHVTAGIVLPPFEDPAG